MEIFDPRELSLGPVPQSRLDRVGESWREYQSTGPFDPEVQTEIRDRFVDARISDTLRIEGVHVTPRITRSIIAGIAVAELDRYQETEVLNIDHALQMLEDAAFRADPLNPHLIRELHRRAMENLVASAGSFRAGDVTITGAAHQPPQAPDVFDLLARMCELYEVGLVERVDPIVLSCWLHATFTRIHPFDDGNGRVGRMLQDYVLLRSRLLPVGIPIARREAYYESLAGADSGHFDDLVVLVANAEINALEVATAVARSPQRRREAIAALVARADAQVSSQAYGQFELWSRRVRQLETELRRWAAEWNSQSRELEFRINPHEGVPFDLWERIQDGSAPQESGWLFDISIHHRRRPLYQLLFRAAAHDPSRVLTTEAGRGPEVGIFAVGAEPGRPYRYDEWSDSVIGLRELLLARDDQQIFFDPAVNKVRLQLDEETAILLEGSEQWVALEVADHISIVESLFEDLLVRFGLI